MAGKRIGWDNLSANQRKRYISKGITKRDYDSGVSLKAGRGHATTPERPERAARKPQDYPEYQKRQAQRKAKAAASGDARKLREQVKKIARRNGLNPSELLEAIKSQDARAKFVIGWQIANSEYEAFGSSSWGRQRLDDYEQAFPELEKAIGYYH
jgi:hypothetical protein